LSRLAVPEHSTANRKNKQRGEIVIASKTIDCTSTLRSYEARAEEAKRANALPTRPAKDLFC
jgi:hypothetical protein